MNSKKNSLTNKIDYHKKIVKSEHQKKEQGKRYSQKKLSYSAAFITAASSGQVPKNITSRSMYSDDTRRGITAGLKARARAAQASTATRSKKTPAKKRPGTKNK